MAKDTSKEGQKFDRNRFLVWAVVVSFVIVTILFSIKGIGIYEWHLADFWARQNYGRNVAEKVAVVGIDDNLFQFGKYEWPLEKDVYGELIMYLEEMGAKVIAFDIEFSNNFQKCGDSDSLFLGMVESSPDVVIGYGFLVDSSSEKTVEYSNGKSVPIPEIPSRNAGLLDQIDARHSAGRGDINLGKFHAKGAEVPYPELAERMHRCGFFNRSIQMVGGIDRFMPLVIEQDSLLFSSLALSSVESYLSDSLHFTLGDRSVDLGDYSWRIDKKADMAVNFTDSIPVYSMSDVMVSFQDYLMGNEPELGKKEFDGKIIFIGYMGHSSGDLGVNPVSTKKDAGMNQNDKTPMVMLHAYSANTMLESRDIFVIDRWQVVLLSFLVVLFVFLLFLKIPQNILNLLIPLTIAGIYAVGFFAYQSYIFLPIVEICATSFFFTVAAIFINYYDSTHETRYISSVFRTYISPELIDEMVKNHTVPKLGGEQIEGTAFFTDIEKFSTFSEIFTPEELINVLNIYFSEMTVILQKNKGTLDKFIGDAIVAIFGAPCFYEENAEQACMAAWNMQEALGSLREKWSLDPDLCDKVGNMRMRIGINSGPFIVGNLGCVDRKNYTMIGDTVNLAARLESGAKQYGVYTLVGESTYESARKSFLFRAVDRIVVVGRREPVSIFELIAPLSEASPLMNMLVEKYGSAMKEYVAGQFQSALTLFRDAVELEVHPNGKNPSKVMVERCEELITQSPEYWDGVYTMRSK